MHTCEFCKKGLVKKPNDTAYTFSRRKYCSQSCQDASKAAKRKLRTETGVDNRITNAILDPDMVRSIREMNRDLGFSAREIGLLKNLRTSTVAAVLSGKTWRHVN